MKQFKFLKVFIFLIIIKLTTFNFSFASEPIVVLEYSSHAVEKTGLNDSNAFVSNPNFAAKHRVKEDESCINPSLVRIPFLVGHVMRVIRFVVGRCPGRRCHVIQLLNSLIIKDAATYPTKALHIEPERMKP